MTKTEPPKLERLPNSPLAEAIFELRWEVNPEATGQFWQLLPGLCYAKLKDKFPTRVNLPASIMPEQMTQHMVRHQFRAGPDRWPVIQLGPGILTANYAEGYTEWKAFLPIIRDALEVLYSSYTEEPPLKPIHVELRYINSVPFDAEKASLTSFLKEQLHTTLLISPQPYDGEQPTPKFSDINLNVTFSTARPKGIGLLLLANGVNDKTPSVIWQFAVQSKQSDAPDKIEDLENWLEESHELIERWFVDLTQGGLLESFKEEPST